MTTIAAGAKSKAEPRPRLTLNRLVRVFQRDKYLYLMVLLPLAYFIVFHYIPLYGITLAFKDFDISEGIMGSPWVGFKYFEEFFTNPYSWLVVRNTVVLRLWQLAIGFPAPIILALLLNELRTIRFKRIVQTSSYLPHFISLVVVSGMVISFLASDGPINSLIKSLGGQSIPFMQLPEWFAPVFTLSGIWQHAGWASVIYLAALTSISPELIEAAVIDGAGRWQRLLHITLPGIAPVVTIMFLLRIGQLLTVDYQMILLLYSPAIYETSDVLGTYIYRRGIVGADFSFATAVGLFQAAVGLVFIVGANWIAKRVGDTSLW
ncbi:MAG: ABC transporter permease subunit [Anaerolineae bacterium]|jgi:putative aldouronate transport system permease protein|nr:ABC transporter permease subunit [Anaerolineae bacterium]